MAVGWRKDYIRYKNYFLNIVALYKKKKDLRMFLEVILSLLTISFFATLALRPTVLTISELLKDIESKEDTLIKLDTKIQNINQAQSLYIANEAQISLLSSSVPETAEPDLFAQQIEGLATIYPISVLGISIGETVLLGDQTIPVQVSENQKVIPSEAKPTNFSISVTGEYQALTQFLDGLETLRRPVYLDSTNITLIDTGERNEIVLSISGRAAYLNEK